MDICVEESMMIRKLVLPIHLDVLSTRRSKRTCMMDEKMGKCMTGGAKRASSKKQEAILETWDRPNGEI